VAPTSKDPYVQAGPDKFLNTDLEKILKDHGIKTVIVTGADSAGAVLHTADGAVFRGFNVVVPVDTSSSAYVFTEKYVAYHFTTAPRLAAGGDADAREHDQVLASDMEQDLTKNRIPAKRPLGDPTIQSANDQP
jgi:nicotinamidase-related amidase